MIYGQSRERRNVIRNEIKPKVQTILGPNYGVQLAEFDSIIGKRQDPFYRYITDPYNTLAGCVFFRAYLMDEDGTDLMERSAVGIYKNGNILWMSDTIMAATWGSIFGAEDINNDGKVEIMTLWYDPNYIDKRSDMWIISWDGTSGKIINDYEFQFGVQAGGATSKIISYPQLFVILDQNNNGIKQIRGEWSDNGYFPEDDGSIPTYPTVTYCWNGNIYTLCPGNQQVPSSTFLPSNHLTVNVRFTISKDDSLRYSYTFINNSKSEQSIAKITLLGGTQNYSTNEPYDWILLNNRYGHQGVFWILPPRNPWIDQETRMIKPGETWSGFKVSSVNTPSIINYYLQGYRRFPHDYSDSSVTDEELYQDMLSNSIKGYTIGPSELSNPFTPLNFLDTLIGYTNTSRSLGWIKEQPTANKYLGYFSSARTKLVQSDSVGARNVLLQVLSDVNVDSTSLFTSEAYALLRYNTEYLVNKLPQVQAAPFFAVKLISSTGIKLTTGSLQYYEGSWKDATINQDGTFSINTNLKTLNLRMTYEYGTQTKSNVPISNDTIVFQTVNAQIQLQNSSGSLIDTGTVQYYSGAWRNIGTTINGVATKELLPNSYSFRMTFGCASNDKQQDISINPTVIFKTINAAVQLKNSQGTLMPAPSGDQGTVQYYSGAWRDLGTTINGVASKDLLPNTYSFRMNYAYASKDKQQNISANATVVFQTVNAAVQLQNSQGTLMDQGTVQYYSGAWRDLGTTVNGSVAKELLPNSYSFRMNYAYASKDKQQDITINPTVIFQTVNTAVQLKNSSGVLMDTGTVQYYSGAWRTFGTTNNGTTNKELLPNSYSFRMTYANVSLDKTQDISGNPTVSYSTVLCTIRVKNSQNQLVDNALASYYSGAWKQIGNTVSGVITKELLPVSLSFRVKYGTQQIDKQQNLSTNNIVDFVIQ